MSESNGHGAGEQVQMTSPFSLVQPVPFSYAVARITLPDGRQAIQLSFFHATGGTALVCMPEEARQLANSINSESGGLIVAVQDSKLPKLPN